MPSKYIPKKPQTVIRQYSLDGKFIAEYKNANDAAKKNKVSQSTIYNCIYGIRKTACGCFWKKESAASPVQNQIIVETYKSSHVISAICQLDLDGNLIKEYQNMNIASKETGIDVHNIINVVNGKGKSAGGYMWRRKTDLEDIVQNKLPKKYARKNSVPVLQLDMDGNLIKRYSTINSAHKETMIPYTTIVKAVSGRAKSAGGFIWKKESV